MGALPGRLQGLYNQGIQQPWTQDHTGLTQIPLEQRSIRGQEHKGLDDRKDSTRYCYRRGTARMVGRRDPRGLYNHYRHKDNTASKQNPPRTTRQSFPPVRTSWDVRTIFTTACNTPTTKAALTSAQHKPYHTRYARYDPNTA